MATFSMSLALSSGGTLSFSTTLTDANAQRIIAAYREILGLDPASTNQQVWTAISQGVFAGIKNNTINHEKVQQEAAIIVADIV